MIKNKILPGHLANEIGVSVHTNNSWLSVLETSYIIFQMPPFYANINKRLVKSHKLYFYDVGLASNLMRIQQPDQLAYHPLRGALFENLVIADIGLVFLPAITLAGLGSIDTLLTSVVADNISRTRHRSNKELIGQGIGNMVASLFGGIPGAGATMRTVVNVKAGGRTKLSGVIHAFLLLLIVLGFGRYVAYIPLAALAGILITVGISIIDTCGLRNIFSISRSDALILIIVLLLTVFVDLLQAVGIGMVIASLIFMRKTSDMVEANTRKLLLPGTSTSSTGTG